MKQYNQQNTGNSPPLPIRTRIVRNLAYRISEIHVETNNGINQQFAVTRQEDAQGRTTARYIAGYPGIVLNSFFSYDLSNRLLCEVSAGGQSCSSGSYIKNSHTASPPFTVAGDWKRLLHPISGTTGGMTHDFSLNSGTHQISQVNQTDGTPTLGITEYSYDSRGNRASDDNTSTLTHDARNYSYDARRNLHVVTGEYYKSGSWRTYSLTSAFDARNRRVFKAFHDDTDNKTAQTFFYYDALDRLTEVVFTPDTSASTTYSVFNFVWLGDRVTLHWQTDYPSSTSTKRYVGTDETGRVVDMICWGTGTNCPRTWAIKPDAYGKDAVLVGSDVFQPALFSGQYVDSETRALLDDGATTHRTAIALNGYRSYDPSTSSYLQFDPKMAKSKYPYLYADGNPIGNRDPRGLMTTFGECGPRDTNGDGYIEDGQNGGAVEMGCTPQNEPTEQTEPGGYPSPDGGTGTNLPGDIPEGGGDDDDSCPLEGGVAGHCDESTPWISVKNHLGNCFALYWAQKNFCAACINQVRTRTVDNCVCNVKLIQVTLVDEGIDPLDCIDRRSDILDCETESCIKCFAVEGALLSKCGISTIP